MNPVNSETLRSTAMTEHYWGKKIKFTTAGTERMSYSASGLLYQSLTSDSH